MPVIHNFVSPMNQNNNIMKNKIVSDNTLSQHSSNRAQIKS